MGDSLRGAPPNAIHSSVGGSGVIGMFLVYVARFVV